MASDNFDRADQDPLAGNWTQTGSGAVVFRLASNAVTMNGFSNDREAFWNAETFADDQYSQVTLTAESGGGAGSGGGVLCRHVGGGVRTFIRAIASIAGDDIEVSNSLPVPRPSSATVRGHWSPVTSSAWKSKATHRTSSSAVYRNGTQVGASFTGVTANDSGNPGIVYSSTVTVSFSTTGKATTSYRQQDRIAWITA